MPTTVYTFGEPQTKWQCGIPQLATGPAGRVIGMDALSTDYYQVPVRAAEAGALVNPTSLVVKLAFITPGAKPASGDWKTGSWDTAPGSVYLAQVLLGPGTGGTVLAKGTYTTWVQVTDNPEIPVVEVGTLQVV